MASSSVAIERLRTGSVLCAMFPDTVSEGTVDVGEMMRQCQYRAEAILEFSVSELHASRGHVHYFDMVQAAKGYISAANSLIDDVLRGEAK